MYKFKQLWINHAKLLVFLLGIILGCLAGVIIGAYQAINVVEVDLKKVIKNYATVVSKSKATMDDIKEDFQLRFNKSMQQMPHKTMVINKSCILSNHAATDYTQTFIQKMRLDNIDEQESK